MKLLARFTHFLNNTVNLNQSRTDDLDGRVDSITGALKGSEVLAGNVLDIVPQGSWAHRTIIRPPSNLEFDADFLVEVAEDTDWNPDPRKYANAVWKALEGHGTYGTMSTQKVRCVRVDYANDCHIDVVPFVRLATGREVIINRTTNEFEDTNPVGFTEWLQGKDEVTGGNLRRTIRLLKYLRDFRGAFKIKSVLLTCLVGEIVESWHEFDPTYYHDVPTTLVHLLEDLDRWLQARPYRPSINDPSCPSTTFDHRWTEAKYTAFRSDIHKLAPEVRVAYDADGIEASVAAWQDVFGTAFPAVVPTTAVTEGLTPLTKAMAVSTDGRAPSENFIEERFPVDLSHSVSIVCEITEPTIGNRKARRQALRSRRGRVPKRRDLLFKLVSTDVPAPFSVYWKVRNRGEEAQRLHQLRGEIIPDDGSCTHKESTSYVGHHYVECYIVKNDRCVAIAREPVIID